MANCVLVVDDEALIADMLMTMVEELGLPVCGSAASADEALALAEHHQPLLVLMDIRLRGVKDGVDAAIAIHRAVGSRVIFITGSREPAVMQRIQNDHPAAILFKPIRFHQLKDAVLRAIG